MDVHNSQEEAPIPVFDAPTTKNTKFLRLDVVESVKTALVEMGIYRINGKDKNGNDKFEPLITDQHFLHLIQTTEGAANPLSVFNSRLPLPRRVEQCEMSMEYEEERAAWRARCQEERKAEPPLTEETVRQPQWATTAAATPSEFKYSADEMDNLEAKRAQLEKFEFKYTEETDSEGQTTVIVEGRRAMIAFFKEMCPYKCVYCTLPGANDRVKAFVKARGGKKLGVDEQLPAFIAAIEETDAGSIPHIQTLELLNDGSFYSPHEIPRETRNAILAYVKTLEFLQTFAVESRPEYIETVEIILDLMALRPDQNLKLYIGLETTDDVASTLVKKWYGWAEFEASVRKIEALPPELRKRVSIVAYNIMKQWCNTEREALEESVLLVQRIAELAEDTGIKIEVKHEPTIVSRGTDQHFFFHHIDENGERMYKNLSYFTVAELITRLNKEGLDDTVAFGQKDDIDQVQTLAKVSLPGNDLAYSPLDFIVYDSVQQFQTDRNFERFRQTIARAVLVDGAFTEEFLEWEKETYGDEPSELRAVVESNPKTIPPETERVINFNDRIASLVEEVTHDEEIITLSFPENEEAISQLVEARFKVVAEEENCRFQKVANVIWIDAAKEDVMTAGVPAKNGLQSGYQVEVILLNNDTGSPSNVWMFIPQAA